MLDADVLRLAIFPVMLTGAVLIWRSGRFVAGRLLILIGTLHLSGVWVGRAAVAGIARGGLFNQADSAVGRLLPRADRELVFWFALWGIWTIFVGELVVLLEQRHVKIPRWFGWQLLAVSLFAAALIPKGGFWWVILPSLLIIRGNPRTVGS